MTDLSYRKALKLDTTRFGTTFDLSAHSILTDIAAVMVPEAYSVRAVPYKLNIYATGDHFKVSRLIALWQDHLVGMRKLSSG